MRAIDLYAGIGGWSLGLRLAGVEVVASYEWWQPAIDTHNGNHGGEFGPVDIRRLKLEDLPSHIDLVVGSPPCTEFSYSNRGGSGNLSEGLKDLVKFLEVVEYLKPRYWALENVPRVAEVLRKGFQDPRHVLYRFRNLNPRIEIFDFSEYGAPQSRRRCIAGNIPFDLIEQYRASLPRRTLGDVIEAISSADVIEDPVWGIKLPSIALTETEAEAALNAEELRMNREAKTYHPIYNNMAFPDALDAPARTVTATCTRVSRESIVIADPECPKSFRRLTVRERACLQGFPITYQFYAKSFPEKAKMVGNAIPPTFTYLVACAALGVSAKSFRPFREAGLSLVLPSKVAPITAPDGEGRSYPAKRGFRAALPGLRFKSGMRFELSNEIDEDSVAWRVRFFFGPSTDIREVDLDGSVISELRRDLAEPVFSNFRARLVRTEAELNRTSPSMLQERWTHRADGMSPFDVVDLLGDLAQELQITLEETMADQEAATRFVSQVASGAPGVGLASGLRKVERYSMPVLAGFIVGDWFNSLGWHSKRRVAA
ncbi:DNA cytosine methyltransferase [Phenylobacterium sp.]|uniref:DNA cytosine methyltransferase n=1 Tax=Phenylobacterium sp. TaxID=1871053 RepID=UPI0025F3BE04|nr:DNA (cytosine-5-)-methyltransferase [Phenylobacterium sp.]MCA3723694.1 DNA (cytosine-5-)-methyltransferase [Phenylobacterium sp.]MCA6261839.1 DNA (cytosine-5-)-methyltransferase [Phenylobacterium sp.]